MVDWSRSVFIINRSYRIPGAGLTLGMTICWLTLLVIVPLLGIFWCTSRLGWHGLWKIWTAPRVLFALRLSFVTALIAALINVCIGSMIAFVFARYTFPGKRIFDAIIDLPFALPTAVAGIALTALYGPSGWLGHWFESWGIKFVFRPSGIVLALIFVGLPFVVRIVQPVLEDLEPELAQVATTLGASRWQTVRRVVVPEILPAVLTGFVLAFARGVGEYGSVVFIAGNLPNYTEIAPLLISIRLGEFDYAGATAIASVMLILSFIVLLSVNLLQSRWIRQT